MESSSETFTAIESPGDALGEGHETILDRARACAPSPGTYVAFELVHHVEHGISVRRQALPRAA